MIRIFSWSLFPFAIKSVKKHNGLFVFSGSAFLSSVTEVSADGEVSQVVSSSHMVSSSHWEAEVGVGDMDEDEDEELPGIAVNPNNMCQQFSSELKKKFQVGHTHTNTHSDTHLYRQHSM